MRKIFVTKVVALILISSSLLCSGFAPSRNFALQNKKLIEPWIESFRKFGQFTETEKKDPSNFQPSSVFQEKNVTAIPTLTDHKEFILQLSPIDANISFDKNQTILFRAQIFQQD